eukprot:GEMP01114695.1.p1 GENE.GEMP01114695.1~~GEMP01114695.1.p1  ORF type:complete len:102 (-),score=1.30 GEMP01114695.1:148-453(-)
MEEKNIVLPVHIFFVATEKVVKERIKTKSGAKYQKMIPQSKGDKKNHSLYSSYETKQIYIFSAGSTRSRSSFKVYNKKTVKDANSFNFCTEEKHLMSFFLP